jgi:predicted nucleic acid-binding Zn ribbon protein
MKRLLSAPAFQFKGTGWYVTDYAKKSGTGGSGSPEPKGEKSAGKSSETPKKKSTESSSKKSD